MQTTVAQVHKLLQENPRLLAGHPVVNLTKKLLRLVSFHPVTPAQASEAVEKALAHMTKDKNVRTLQMSIDGYCRLFVDLLVPYALKRVGKESSDQLKDRVKTTAHDLKLLLKKCLFEISFLPGGKIDDVNRFLNLTEAEHNEYAQQFLRDLFLLQNYYFIKEQTDATTASSISNRAFIALERGKIQECKTLFDVKKFLNNYCREALKKREKARRPKSKKLLFS